MRAMAHLYLLIILVFIFVVNSSCEQPKCTHINYRGRNQTSHYPSNHTCPAHPVCRRTLTISYVEIPPYCNGRLFETIVEGCCGKSCTSFQLMNNYTNISHIQLSHDKSSDFILPFLGSSSATLLYGYHFIPFVNAPYAYYITPKHASPITLLLNNMVGMYALIILCLFSAVISGFIIWICEQFSTWKCEYYPFFCGLFECFWWSFTVVTSGYGAAVVKTIPAKVYSVIWILVGVVMFSLMTSAFTAELMNIMGRHRDSISGGEVGVLQFRDYDASLVVREGGIIRETNAPNFHADVDDLIRLLRKKEIDGILLDKYTLAYTRGYLEWKAHTSHVDAESKEDINYFLTTTDSTLQEYKGEKLSYGVLVKKHEDYLFLNSAVRDNRLSLEIAVELEMNKIFPRKKQGAIIDPGQSILFWELVGWAAVIIGGIFLFGIFYELYHLSRKQKKGLFGIDAIGCLVDRVKDEEN